MHLPENNYPVVCFGEILWDILPSGNAPGGAPMNVAYHLKKLGVNPAVISRVGLDDWGKHLIGFMEAHHMETGFFQLDYVLETGKVNASVQGNNEMSYDILKPVAWDNITESPDFEALVANSEFFVFGSLAARSEISRRTLFQLLETARCKVLDINLRAPHYNREIVERLLLNTDLLKLNHAELELVTGWFSRFKSDLDRIRILQDVFCIENIVVTKGSDGALLNIGGGVVYEYPGYPVTVADTVGSGDAFLAGMLAKLLEGADSAEALEFGNALGAFVASCHGACPDYDIIMIDNLIKEKKQFV